MLPKLKTIELIQENAIERVNDVELLVVGGTLGSGKTTFIKSLFESGRFEGKKVAIVNGDFAGANMKWEGVEAPDVDRFPSYAELSDIKGITSGCVCCKSQDELVQAVNHFLGQKVDTIVVECSGVTDPQRVRLALWERLPIKTVPHVVALVNAQVFDQGTPMAQEVSILCAASADSVGITHVNENTKDGEALIRSHAAQGVRVGLLTAVGDVRTIDKVQIDEVLGSFGGIGSLSMPRFVDRERDSAFGAHRANYSQLVVVLHPGISADEIQRGLAEASVQICRAKGVVWDDQRECDVDYINGRISVSPRHAASAILPGRSWLRIDAATADLEEKHVASIGIPQFSLEFVERVGEAYHSAVSNPYQAAEPEADIAFFRGVALLNALPAIPEAYSEVRRDAYTGFLLATIGYSKFRVFQAQRLQGEEYANDERALRAQALLGVDLALVDHSLPAEPAERAALEDYFGHLQEVSASRVFFAGARLLAEPPYINGKADLGDEAFAIYAKLIRNGIEEGLARQQIVETIEHLIERGTMMKALAHANAELSWAQRGTQLLDLSK